MKPLKNIVSPKTRQWIFLAVTLAQLVFGVWQASDGNWNVFAGSLLTALVTFMAHNNVDIGSVFGAGDNAPAVDPKL